MWAEDDIYSWGQQIWKNFKLAGRATLCPHSVFPGVLVYAYNPTTQEAETGNHNKSEADLKKKKTPYNFPGWRIHILHQLCKQRESTASPEGRSGPKNSCSSMNFHSILDSLGHWTGKSMANMYTLALKTDPLQVTEQVKGCLGKSYSACKT